MKEVMEKLGFYLRHRCRSAIETEAFVFSNEYGLLGQTPGAAALLEKCRE